MTIFPSAGPHARHDPDDPRLVQFFGGIADKETLLVPFPSVVIHLRLAAPYECGHIGYDIYERHGNVALYLYHIPAPEHVKPWQDAMDGHDGDEWKRGC